MQSPDPAPSLSDSVASGAAWLAGVRLLVRAIGLVSTLILARLLLPEDFGLVALATALLFILETLSDLRFEQAIIAQRDTGDDDLNTAWTLNVMRGIGVALLVAALAYPYALIMDDDRLVALLLAISLVAVIDGFKNTAFVTYEKSMVFHREFALQLSHKLIAFAVTVTLAWLYRSYWALVAGILTGATVKVIASYVMHPYRPRFGVSAWRRLAGFSGWLMASNVIAALLQKAEFFLIGIFLPVRMVGLFHIGSELSSMASNELVLPIKRALFPALSTLGDQPERQFDNFRSAIEVVAAVALPIGTGLSLVAEPLVLLALGERWRESATVIAFLGPVAATWAIAGLCDTLTLSRGNTRMIFSRELVKAAYIIPLYTLGVWQGGLQGLLYTMVVVVILSLGVNLDMVRRQSGRPLLAPIRGAWRSLMACAVMAAAVTGFERLLPTDNNTAILGLALSLLGMVGVGAIVYMSVHYLLWWLNGRPPGAERFLVDFAARRLRRS